jgi:Predicted periplasmic protein (DUF2092)
MLDKLIKQLNFTPPLADFLYSDPYKNLRGTIQYGFVSGETQINGRSCRGLAFVEKHIDWQMRQQHKRIRLLRLLFRPQTASSSHLLMARKVFQRRLVFYRPKSHLAPMPSR